MLDKVLAIFSLALLIAFTGVIVWYIARPNLTVIVVLVVALAVYDFWRELWGSRKG